MGPITTGVLFAGLWLSELVPALLTGTVPASLIDAGWWVNPIHVIDLSVVLPGLIVSGVAALQGREHGLFWLAPWLVLTAVMGSSILAAMVLMMAEDATNALPVTRPRGGAGLGPRWRGEPRWLCECRL